jgi:CubicO group peptidase (beta-lactamase class C family)
MIQHHVVQVALRRCNSVVFIALALLIAVSALPPSALANLPDSAELEQFIDPIIAEQMDEYALPGVSVAIVHQGDVVLTKGYGVLEDGTGTAVDPEQTIFDLGSVAKLFTSTAVMQQVEAGNLDLDTDVREYLANSIVEIPDDYDESITLRHLLTHTAGFDERLYLGMIAPGPDEIQPLDENLDEHMPPRIRPPGETNQYSNAGMTLAGHIVEEVSGGTFDEYIENHIFEPLGMERSTYDYPEALQPDTATGHESIPGPATPVDIWHLNDRPAGGLRSTANDISQFMIAHLDEGGDILSSETTGEMHSSQFRAHEGISGSAIGWIEHQVGDRRGLHHGGQWIGFSSLLYLLPDEEFGVFVAANHGSGIYTQYQFVEALLDEYFPAEGTPTGEADSINGEVSGTFRWNRIDRHTFMQLVSVLNAITITIEDNGDDTISTSMSPALIPDTTWQLSAPGVYQETGGTNRLGVEFDDNGDASTVHLAWPLLMTMDEVAWHQSTGLHIALLAFFLITLLTTLAWPVRRLARRFRGRHLDLDTDHARTRLIAGTTAGLILAFLIGTLLMVAIDTVWFFQIPTLFKLWLWLPIIAAILTVPLVVFVVRLWMHGKADPARRIHLTLIAVAMVGLVPYLWYWGVLGFNY